MRNEQNDKLDRLLRHLGYVSWLALLYQYNDTHLLIMDADMLEKIHQARKFELRCKTATPENYRESVTPGVKKVLVLCRKKELPIVRELSREYPNLSVTSGTYGHMLVGPERQARLVPFKSGGKGRLMKRPIVILSTPSADAEFIANSIHANGGALFHEYFSRPYATWMSICQDFQSSRLVHEVQGRFFKGENLRVLLQLDVLEALFRHTTVTKRRFIQFLERYNAKVLIVKRRHHMVQAVSGQLLDRSFERSVWTKRPNREMSVKYSSNDFVESLQRYDALSAQEDFLDLIAGGSLDCSEVYLEDFIHGQRALLPKLAKFLETEVNENIEPLDYRKGFEGAKNFFPAYTQFRCEYLDRTGYHVPPLEQYLSFS